MNKFFKLHLKLNLLFKIIIIVINKYQNSYKIYIKELVMISKNLNSKIIK